jgi:hypothetical protein
MKHIVSVSLGSSKRDKVLETEILGTPVRIERRGTDGDKRRFQQLLRELDGSVDAIGVGGCDLYLWAQGRRYTFRDVQRLVSVVRHTPVVDGSGLKNTLERWAVERIEQRGLLDWSTQNVLLVSALDRFGMAEALAEKTASVIFGDALFAIGLPLPIRDIRTLARLARVVLPVVVRLPFEWVYPIGEKQEHNTPRWERYFRWADVIAGDWHYIRRYAPEDLSGKVILTNTVRQADVQFLQERGADLLVNHHSRLPGRNLRHQRAGGGYRRPQRLGGPARVGLSPLAFPLGLGRGGGGGEDACCLVANTKTSLSL